MSRASRRPSAPTFSSTVSRPRTRIELTVLHTAAAPSTALPLSVLGRRERRRPRGSGSLSQVAALPRLHAEPASRVLDPPASLRRDYEARLADALAGAPSARDRAGRTRDGETEPAAPPMREAWPPADADDVPLVTVSDRRRNHALPRPSPPTSRTRTTFSFSRARRYESAADHLTGDTHPIHLHSTPFVQLLTRGPIRYEIPGGAASRPRSR